MTNNSFAFPHLPVDHRPVQRQRTSRSLLRRCAAVSCLAAFLLGNSDLPPAAAALAARLDGSHEVRVTSQEGGFCVVLHHATGPDADPRMWASHQHGFVSRLLCAFWAAPSGESDHLLAFAAGGLCESEFGAEELASAGKARVVLPQEVSFSCPAIVAVPIVCSQTALAMLTEHANAPPFFTAAVSGRCFQLLI